MVDNYLNMCRENTPGAEIVRSKTNRLFVLSVSFKFVSTMKFIYTFIWYLRKMSIFRAQFLYNLSDSNVIVIL